MEQNERDRGLDGLGGSAGERPLNDDGFLTDRGMSAGAANTPSFGDPTAGAEPAGTRSGEESHSRLEQGREVLEERMEGMRNRVEEQLDQGMRSAADRMEGIAQRLDDVADERMSGDGWKGKAGGVAHGVADRIETTAEYLRSNDAGSLVSRLEDQVRERPLEMLLLGAATGWLAGKILR